MGMNLQLSASANGTRNTGPVNMGGGANLIQRSLFATNTPNLAYSQWYTPGIGSPAVSTSDYYHINGVYVSRPYDLDTMGSEGATIKAREGCRYVWIIASDHPSNTNFADGGNFFVGYTNDPQVWPSSIAVLRYLNDVITMVDQNGFTQTNLNAYMAPYLVYNPDSAGDKFWVYAEGSAGSRQHELVLFTTADFLTTALVEPVIPTTTFGGWSSFGKPTRLGVNDWIVYSFGKPDGSATSPAWYKYTSTNGTVWTPDFTQELAGPGPFVSVSGQDYLITQEISGSNKYLSLLAVDADKVSLGTYTRISTTFGNDNGNATVFPGPTYLQADTDAYEEDGIASIYVTRGFFSGVTNSLMQGPYLNNYPTFYNLVGEITTNTTLTVTSRDPGAPALAIGHRVLFLANSPIYITAFGTGTGDTGTYTITSTNNIAAGTTFTVACNGGLFHQFIDQYYYITDSTAAADAAPLGVIADCVSGTVTISWNNCLPHQNYRVYRGTDATTQATLIGDVTGISITDTPTPGDQYFYKVVTMNSGEQGSRVVNVYASNNTLMVTRHVNRVINDGGDPGTIDMTFLASVDSYLTSNDYWKYLLHWVDIRFGYKLDGSSFVSKIYCLGTTQLPRGGDYTPTTSNTYPSTSSNTSYSATSFRGTTPSWINNANTARGFFGNGRANTIQRKNEITIIAAYQRPNSTGTASFFGMGQSSGMNLSQASGASGNVTFNIYYSGSPITATVAFASATSPHIAAGVYDGTNLTAYLDGVAGTPVDGTAMTNSDMTKATPLRGVYTTSLEPTTQVDTLMSGTNAGRFTPSTKAYNNSDNMGQYTGACLAVFEKGSASIVADITALYA